MQDTALPAGVDRLALLQTFVHIVEAGSLSAAAARGGTSQPTISRRLQMLERRLGVRLLQRSTHAMKLTPDGERCFAHAKGLLDNWQAIEADLRGAQHEARGALRVVAPHAFGQEQLIAPLLEFLRRHPQVSVEWLLYDRLPDFIAQGVDCAIRVGAVEEPGVVAIRLAEVPRIVVAAPGLWGRGKPPQHPQALQDLPWLAFRTYYRDEVQLTQQPGGQTLRLPIRPRLATDSLHALRQAALGGAGAALLSAWVVADDLAQGRLVQLAPAWAAPPLPVYLVYPQAPFLPARLRAFTELMRAWMPRIAGMLAPTRASAGAAPRTRR